MSLDYTQGILFTAITILVPFFTSKAYNVYDVKEDVGCTYAPYNAPFEVRNEGDKCYKKQNEINKKYNAKKLTVMLGCSFIYITIGYMLNRAIPNVSIRAVSLGGLLLMLHSLFINWSEFNEKHQVIILGIMLLFLLIFGARITTTSMHNLLTNM
jgi:hypothetical protein